jgi:hypothetical protein
MSEIERRIFNLEMALFGTSGNSWHSTGTLSSGESFGKTGAMTHLTDLKGYPLSKGYHEITGRCFSYTGRIGAHEERFSLDWGSIKYRDELLLKNNDTKPETIQGYTAEQWQEVIDGGYLCEFHSPAIDESHLGLLREIDSRNTFSCTDYSDWENCRPAQIKGVMRPIWVEPVDKEATCVVMSSGATVLYNGTWHDGWSKSTNGHATKYIEL